jgi:hypothetical protein
MNCDLGSCSNVPAPPPPPRSVRPYVWGRVYDANGNPSWVQVSTDDAGFSDYLYITALIQCMKGNLGESPFWANFGLPAHQSVLQQLPPDFNVNFIAQFYQQFFASLIIAKVAPSFAASIPKENTGPYGKTLPNLPIPKYYIQIMRKNGSIFQAAIGT